MPLPPSSVPPDEVRDKAAEILRRPEFQQPPRTLLQRITDFVGHLIDRALSALLGGGRAGWVGWIILTAAVVAIAFFAFRLVRGVTVDVRAGGPDDGLGGPRRSAVDWRREAEEHEAAGRWRDAVRCRYRELVAELAHRGLVEEVAGRTAGEYRLQVSATAPDAVVPFAAATELFEAAWYGDAVVTAADAERMRALRESTLRPVGA